MTSENKDELRKLLLAKFSNEDLRQFIYDNPEFNEVYNNLKSEMSVSSIVRKLVNYAESQGNLNYLRNMVHNSVSNTSQTETQLPSIKEKDIKSSTSTTHFSSYSQRHSIRLDAQRGLKILDAYIKESAPDFLEDFLALEMRIADNEYDQRMLGKSDNIKVSRNEIIRDLNRLALDCSNISFNDMCRGIKPDS